MIDEYEFINGKKYKKCKENQIRNPLTNKCINKKEIKNNDEYEFINGKKYKKCKENQVRNPLTNRCINKKEIKDENKFVLKMKSPLSIKKEIKNENKFILDMKTPLSYKINQKNVKKFLKACDEPFINPTTNKKEIIDLKEASKKLINATKHVSFEEFIKRLTINIHDMVKHIENERPLFININLLKYKEKSNYWIYLYLINYMKYKYPNIQIILLESNNITHEKLLNNDLIILIDDCIYSGQQMAFNIIDIIKNKKLSLRFYILCSYITKNSMYKITNVFYNNKYLKKDKLEFNKYIYNPISTNDIISYDDIDNFDSIYTSKFIYFDKKYLIYFDHKLADSISTITPFYSGIVPNAKNKYYISKKQYDKLDIIPLFKNCENIRNLNMAKPECPSTPYKKDINDKFIFDYKKRLDKKAKSLTSSSKTKTEIKKYSY